MNVNAAIRTKRAVRQFKDQSLPLEAVQAILNAGRRSQSSKNTQPWQFISIQDKAILKSLSQARSGDGHWFSDKMTRQASKRCAPARHQRQLCVSMSALAAG